MSISRNGQGGITIYDWDQAGYLFRQTYYYYTMKEAKAKFREALDKQNSTYIWGISA